MTLNNNQRQCKPLRAILTGQPPNAQVTDTRGTVYGSVRLSRPECDVAA